MSLYKVKISMHKSTIKYKLLCTIENTAKFSKKNVSLKLKPIFYFTRSSIFYVLQEWFVKLEDTLDPNHRYHGPTLQICLIILSKLAHLRPSWANIYGLGPILNWPITRTSES